MPTRMNCPAVRFETLGPGLVLCGALAGAQTTGGSWRDRVLGVYNGSTGEPIEAAEVMDLTSGTWAVTTKTGTVTLAFLPDGGSLVRIRKVGYTPALRFISISPADTLPVTLTLAPSGTMLPTVTITDSARHHASPGLSAFDTRRAAGFGHFIDEAELRKSDARALTDVLRGVNGVDVRCTRGTTACYATSARSSGCRLVMYVDGALVSDPDVTKLHVADFGGVEIYTGPATIPAQYNMTGSACGVILFWTRDR